MSIATGSTSWTPYIVCTSSGQNAPNAARKTSLFNDGAEREEEQRDQRRRGDRAQELDRHAERARRRSSLVPSTIPIGTASTVAIAEAERPAAHRVGEVLPELAGLHQRPQLLHRGASSRAGRSPRRARRARRTPRAQVRRATDASGRRKSTAADGPGGARRHVPFRDHRAARDLPSDDHCVLYIARDVEYPRHRSSSRDRTANAVPRASSAPHAPGFSSFSRSSCSARTCERCSRACRRCSKTCVPSSGSRRPPRVC